MHSGGGAGGGLWPTPPAKGLTPVAKAGGGEDSYYMDEESSDVFIDKLGNFDVIAKVCTI